MIDFEEILIKALSSIQQKKSGTRPPLRKNPGDIVYVANESSDKLFLVTKGVIELSRPLDDGPQLCDQSTGSQARVAVKVVKLGWVGPGGMIGELEFLARKEGGRHYPKRHFNARAISGVELLELPYAQLIEALPEHPIVEEALRRHMVAWLDSMAETIGAARFQPMPVRLARVLRDLAITAAPGPVGSDRRVITLESCPPQDEIAIAVGETRETISREIKQWERAGILRNGERQMLVITDFQWLGEIAKLGETMQRQTHDDRCSRIDFMLDTGENYRARNLALQLVEKTYPLSPEIQYRACLACARAGGTEEAMRLADRFGFNADLESLERAVRAGFANPLARRERDLGEDNRVEDIDETEEDRAEQQKRLDQLIEDISVLAGRLAKDAAFASAPGTERNASLTRAMNRYNDVYERTQRPFSGINAASMAAMLGQAEKATRIAKLVKSRPPSDLATYWHAATRAEVSALLGDTKDAKAAMALAAGMKDATIGRRSSTRKQLIRLRGAVVPECLDALLEGLPVPIPIVYSGHLMLGSQLTESAQRDAENNLVANLKAKLKELGVGSAYGALAAGSDIVIAEEVLKHGAALHVVLPRRFAEFVKASVEPGDPREAPGHWRRRFDNCLAKATSVTILHEGTVGAQEQDAMFQAGFRLAAGLALLQADELVTRAAMLAVYDGGPVGSIAGTAMALQAWRATSEPLHELPCSWRRPGKGANATAATPFRPVIFIWAKPSHKAKATSSASTPVEFLERAVATAIGGKPPLLRKSTDDCMVALVCSDVSEAARLALQLAQKLQGEFASLSIVCDFSPALDSKGAPSSRRMADMRGASEMPDVPPGGVSTTEGFAAEARLDTAFAHRLQPMGRIAVAATRQTTGMPLPSIRMFQLLAPPAAGA